MKKLLAALYFTLALSSIALSVKSEITTSTENTTTEHTTLSSVTTKISTTSSPPQTTTEPDTTTKPTTAPDTSTKPTTEPTNTTIISSTSPEPVTTTAISTSTSGPVTTRSPIPVPDEGFWNVTSGNTTCIRADLKILFRISLEDHEDYIALSPNASSEDSDCMVSNLTQKLELTDSTYTLQFIFEKDSDNVYVRNISFSYRLPDGAGTVENNTRLFSVKAGNSYMCSAAIDVTLGNVTMEISKIRIQAFGNENNKDFGTAEECEADDIVNDIVPIAVGIALLSLVVIVLIAYLVGRRRSRQKGYQSV